MRRGRVRAWRREFREGRLGYVTERVLMQIHSLDLSVGNPPLEIFDLFAWIDFAEIAEVVEADECMGGFSHGGNVEPAFSSAFVWCF